MEIYLVRHGQSEANKNDFYATKDTPLSDEGKIQAQLISQRLENIEFDKKISSPYLRAIQTMEFISNEYAIDERVKEQIIGFEGLKYSNILSDRKEDYESFLSAPLNYKIQNCESRMDVYNRAVEFLKDLDFSLNRILIVSHENFISSVLGYVFNDPKYMFKFIVENAKYSVIAENNGSWYIKNINC